MGVMGERRDAYKGLVGKPKGKRTLVRLRHRWDVNVKRDIQEIFWRC